MENSHCLVSSGMYCIYHLGRKGVQGYEVLQRSAKEFWPAHVNVTWLIDFFRRDRARPEQIAN